MDTHSAGPDQDLLAALAELDAQPVPAGVDSDVYDQLKAEFTRVMMELYPDGKLPAACPPADESCCSVTVLDCDNELSWYMENPGDYNQDGLVSVNDLTPLGFYFNQAGPFAPDSAQSVVDGNHDGLIAVSDITPIGQNFGNQITTYNVYASDDLADHPRSTSAKSASAATLLGSVNVADVTAAAGERKRFSFDASAVTEQNLWVAGSDGTAEGVASTVANGRWHTVDNILPTGVTGKRASIVILDDGRLAVAFFDPEHLSIQYMESLDAAGGSWEDPITIATNVQPNNFPKLATGQYGMYIGYFAAGVFMVSQSAEPEHASWTSYELTAMGGAGGGGGKLVSDPQDPVFSWVGAFGDHAHGLFIVDNKLYHMGCVGIGVVYTGTNMSGMQVSVDEDLGIITVSFIDNGWLMVGCWVEDLGWAFHNTFQYSNPDTYWDYSTPSVMTNAIVGTAHAGEDNQFDFTYYPTGQQQDYQTVSLGSLEGTDPTFKIVHTGDEENSQSSELISPRFSPITWLVDDTRFKCLARGARYVDKSMSTDAQLFAASMAATQELDEYESRIEAETAYRNGSQQTAAVFSLQQDQEYQVGISVYY
ncbi:hypothetical protein JW859_05020 [bacterium]|nr:hypothetical protein [bacterium]